MIYAETDHYTAMHTVHNIVWQDSLFSTCRLSFYIPTFHMIVIRWLYQFPFWHLLWILSNTRGSRYWYHFFMAYCLVNLYFLYIEFLRKIRGLTQQTVFNVDLYVFGKRKTHMGPDKQESITKPTSTHNNIPHLQCLLPTCSGIEMTSQIKESQWNWKAAHRRN